MIRRDLVQHLAPEQAIVAAALAADNTPVAIDLQGCGSALILILVGIGGITFSGVNKIEFVLTHSDDNVTYSAVAADDVRLGLNADASVGTGGIVRSLIAAHAAGTVTKVGYKGNKRYLKLLADFTGTHGVATPIAALVVKGNLEIEGPTGL